MDLTPWSIRERFFIMARKKKANRTLRSLPLSLAMTRERAIEITSRVPLCSVFRPNFKTVSGVEYGPYWWATFTREGIPQQEYVGLQAKRDEIEAAHAFVRAELEAAALKLPAETRELIALERRLFGEPPSLPSRERLKKTDPERAASASGSLLGSSHPSRREASR